MPAGIEKIAQSLKAARQAKILTQKELGQRVGLPQSHVSKIESGGVDLQVSSLVELARALDLEVKLVPRSALPAVEGAVRAQGTTTETSRALAALNEQGHLAERLQREYPDIPATEDFLKAIREMPKFQFDAAQLAALDTALKPAKQLQKLLAEQGGLGEIANRITEATSSIRHFRNMQAHRSLAEPSRQRPAYRLEDDDE